MNKEYLVKSEQFISLSALPFHKELQLINYQDLTQDNTIQYNTIQYNTIQYNTIQYNTIQYNTIQYNKIQYTNVVGSRTGYTFWIFPLRNRVVNLKRRAHIPF